MIELGQVGAISHAKAVYTGSKLLVQTVFEDDAALAQNRRIHDSGMLDKSKLGLHDDEDIRFVISCPCTEQWSLFKRKHPDIYKALKTGGGRAEDDRQRMTGARRLSVLHPEWVVFSRM